MLKFLKAETNKVSPIVLACIGLLAASLAAADEKTYVAEPGVGFGPFRIGDKPDASWSLLCRESYAAWYYYTSSGLVAKVPSEGDFRGIDAIYIEPTTPIPADHFRRGCVLPSGKALTSTFLSERPSGAVYISKPTYARQRGARVGDKADAVLVAHGVPRTVYLRSGDVPTLVSLNYCGIDFEFDVTGNVERIEVSRAIRCDPGPQRAVSYSTRHK